MGVSVEWDRDLTEDGNEPLQPEQCLQLFEILWYCYVPDDHSPPIHLIKSEDTDEYFRMDDEFGKFPVPCSNPITGDIWLPQTRWDLSTVLHEGVHSILSWHDRPRDIDPEVWKPIVRVSREEPIGKSFFDMDGAISLEEWVEATQGWDEGHGPRFVTLVLEVYKDWLGVNDAEVTEWECGNDQKIERAPRCEVPPRLHAPDIPDWVPPTWLRAAPLEAD